MQIYMKHFVVQARHVSCELQKSNILVVQILVIQLCCFSIFCENCTGTYTDGFNGNCELCLTNLCLVFSELEWLMFKWTMLYGQWKINQFILCLALDAVGHCISISSDYRSAQVHKRRWTMCRYISNIASNGRSVQVGRSL